MAELVLVLVVAIGAAAIGVGLGIVISRRLIQGVVDRLARADDQPTVEEADGGAA